MPEYRNGAVSFSFDLCGCPNRCRHCWLGQASVGRMDLTKALSCFHKAKAYVQRSGDIFGLKNVKYFGSYFREPHYCSNYRELREIELELNGGVDYAATYELLSVWRLAHDPGYAQWASSIGVKKCQIALFGLEATNDWFCRRQGAHRDIVMATLRLMENGILPRWMIIQTKKGLPEFPGILGLIDALKLRNRAADIGGRFDVFLNDPTPIGEAQRLQDIRLTESDVPLIPKELILATEEYTRKPLNMKTESEWIRQMGADEDGPIGLEYPDELWFFVASDWTVYPNIGTLESWWRLGDLNKDDLPSIFACFHADKAPALRAGNELTVHGAARSYGNRNGDQLYTSRTDLYQLWLEQYCGDRSSMKSVT